MQRTVSWLPASNGYGAVMVDLKTARLTHFREHLFATEEPKLDGQGKELWNGNQPLAVPSRDLLYDAYFGLRHDGQQKWLTGLPVDADRSGYVGWKAGVSGGTGIAALVQTDGDLELTSYFFAPRALPHNGFVMLVKVANKGTKAISGAQAFSIHWLTGVARGGPWNTNSGSTTSFGGVPLAQACSISAIACATFRWMIVHAAALSGASLATSLLI